MLFKLFGEKIYQKLDEIEACKTECPSVTCVRNYIHRKQMWFGEWVEGEPQKRKSCSNYLEKFDESIDTSIRSDL